MQYETKTHKIHRDNYRQTRCVEQVLIQCSANSYV